MIILFFSRRKSPAHETIEKNYQNWNPKEIRNPKIDTATEPAQQQIRAGGESSIEGGISIQIQVILENWRVDNGEWNVFFENYSASDEIVDRRCDFSPEDVECVLNKVWSEASALYHSDEKRHILSRLRHLKDNRNRELNVSLWRWCDVDRWIEHNNVEPSVVKC